mmetsp:Transcript_21028/g.35928  ORF Transcript_21028/g.35928 Transcript_21028/m.35928 type:complete len:394 (-) Transcript_21028:33-1214(-)
MDHQGYDFDSHEKAFAVIPKIGGVLSIIGSLLILRDVFLKFKEHKTIPLTTKIMTLITVANLALGFWENFLSTWMVPKDSIAFLASGNVTSCNFQAFVAVSMYMVVETAYTMLSVLYYITVVRRDWTTQKTQSLTVRFSFLGLPIIIGLGTAVSLLVMQQFNFDGVYSCNIASYPLNCHYINDLPCTRAPNAAHIRAGLYMYVFACFAIIIIFLSMLLYNVKKQDTETERYACEYLKGVKGEGIRSNPVAFQSLRYLTAFFIPNIAFIIWGVMDISNIELSDNGWLIAVYLYVILWPLFGALNSLVYFRLRYLNEKKSNPEATWSSLIGKTLSIHPPSRRSTANETLPPPISSLIDEDDLYSPLFEDESAYGSNEGLLSGATAGPTTISFDAL